MGMLFDIVFTDRVGSATRVVAVRHLLRWPSNGGFRRGVRKVPGKEIAMSKKSVPAVVEPSVSSPKARRITDDFKRDSVPLRSLWFPIYFLPLSFFLPALAMKEERSSQKDRGAKCQDRTGKSAHPPTITSRLPHSTQPVQPVAAPTRAGTRRPATSICDHAARGWPVRVRSAS